MIRYLPVLIELGLLIYCLIDIIQTPEGEIRNLPKVWWVVLLIILPLVGGIAWLVAGRPRGARNTTTPWPAGPTAGFPEYERPRHYERPGRRPVGPDDDPDFLSRLDPADDAKPAHEKPPHEKPSRAEPDVDPDASGTAVVD